MENIIACCCILTLLDTRVLRICMVGSERSEGSEIRTISPLLFVGGQNERTKNQRTNEWWRNHVVPSERVCIHMIWRWSIYNTGLAALVQSQCNAIRNATFIILCNCGVAFCDAWALVWWIVCRDQKPLDRKRIYINDHDDSTIITLVRYFGHQAPEGTVYPWHPLECNFPRLVDIQNISSGGKWDLGRPPSDLLGIPCGADQCRTHPTTQGKTRSSAWKMYVTYSIVNDWP